MVNNQIFGKKTSISPKRDGMTNVENLTSKQNQKLAIRKTDWSDRYHCPDKAVKVKMDWTCSS